MKAILRVHHKLKLHERYTVELTIHEVPVSAKYPQGVKYGLICMDEQTGKRVLFDNHHPKGPHMHLDEQELDYEFTTEEKLVADFKQLVLENMGIKL